VRGIIYYWLDAFNEMVYGKGDDNMTKTLAKNGRKILNENIRKDYARLLEIIADKREPDFEEVEKLAGKYRMYFDDAGELKEAK